MFYVYGQVFYDSTWIKQEAQRATVAHLSTMIEREKNFGMEPKITLSLHLTCF